MENIKHFFENIWVIHIIKSLVAIIVSILFYKIITYFLVKGENGLVVRLFSNKKSKTYSRLIRSIIRYFFILITCLVLLEINGIDVTSVIAGVGILGVVFGLAIQDFLKDIIRGSSILSDSYFSVGDIVKYNDIEAKVLVIGLKTTKIQDIRTGNVLSIANRNIEEIELVSNLVYINIPIGYDISVEQAEKTISDIGSAILKNNNVEGFTYKGVNELDSSSINYLIEVKCNPLNRLQVRRDSLRTILLELKNNNIEVPFEQIDIHNK